MGYYQYIYYRICTLSFLETSSQSFLDTTGQFFLDILLLGGTSLQNVLVAFGSKRTVADLFSDRKGCGLESRSYFHPGRNGCLEKMASSSESRILSTNTPLPLTSPWPFSQNRVQIGKVPAAKSPRSPLATSGLGSAD